jgi:hypothetical protein
LALSPSGNSGRRLPRAAKPPHCCHENSPYAVSRLLQCSRCIIPTLSARQQADPERAYLLGVAVLAAQGPLAPGEADRPGAVDRWLLRSSVASFWTAPSSKGSRWCTFPQSEAVRVSRLSHLLHMREPQPVGPGPLPGPSPSTHSDRYDPQTVISVASIAAAVHP